MMEKETSASTVAKAIQLMKLIASSHSRSLRLVDLAQAAGLERSTTHRLLQRLVKEEMLVRLKGQKGYRLGPLVHELGLGALPRTNLREACHPALRLLAEQTGDMAFLVERNGFESVCVDRIAGDFPIQTLTSGIGDRHPLGVGAGGLSILAALSDDEIDLVLNHIQTRLTQYQTFTIESIRHSIEQTRARGYAIDAGHAASGVSAMGMVLRLNNGTPAAAVFVASISSRMDATRLAIVEKRMAAAAQLMEAAMNQK
jgi:DNA-binding IclR family transcriptional regulator